ncbi:MAG: membrane protein insertion efficiency factor YidD [bacterium]|nr:membrane protein insertion efficiency factor YidD [bacterium]
METTLLISRLLAAPLVLIVRVYQRTLSPDHGLYKAHYPNGYCRFYPSCSEYAVSGLRSAGILALPKIVWRLVRCQPWSLGGVDHYSHTHVANNIR